MLFTMLFFRHGYVLQPEILTCLNHYKKQAQRQSTLTHGADYDGHSTFKLHFANAMSTFAQVTTQKGEFDAASFVSIRTSLLSELLGKCLEIAANDFEISQMCYQSVFNSDYYWE